MPASTDRNLLFGILALQMDFITREQLIAGMQAWVLAKDQPLAEHLEGVGALASANRQLLEPLVAAHIRQHNDDPLQSLASVSSLGSVREELARFADRDVEASLACVPQDRAQREPVDPLATMTVALNSANGGGRFRILRPHAEGGLGRVYVARDQELGREVALKEIKPEKSANPDNRSRFAREAEITGGLEHPGIVPVYGLGTYSDGRPYYAMRFIRGHSLKEAIEQFHRPAGQNAKPIGATERNLQLRRLLQRLIDVCEAIDYAHSRGVLHRDLKPGNIMLGRYGETLVVDWGLAKALGKAAWDEATSVEPTCAAGDDETVPHDPLPETPLVPSSGGSSEPTILGATIGTPAFMSPEQAQGRLDLVSAASDVFSLGATLYQVLTGRPPYQGDNLLGLARGANYPPPRSLKTDVPRPLESICLKALAAEPKERFASARALAQDLERFLGDEPLVAYDDTRVERLARWSRKNRVFVAVTWALTASAACLLSVVAIALISRALVDARDQRHRAEGDRMKAERLATENQRIANEKTLLATQERTQRESAQKLARENLLLAEELAAQKSAVTEFLVGTFQASDPIGLGGVSFFLNKGDSEKLTAGEILKRGAVRIETNEELKRHPLSRAAILQTIGNTCRATGEFGQAKILLTESLEIRRSLLAPDHPDVAESCYHLGWVYHEIGDFPRARPLYEEALRIRRQLPGSDGARQTAAVLRNLGWMLAFDADDEAAERTFREALELPLSPGGKADRDVAFAKFGLAFTMVNQSRRVPALAMALDARREWERAENNPQLSLGATAFALGVISREVPGLAGYSEARLREAIDIVTPITGKDYYIVGIMHFELAQTLDFLGRHDDADRHYQEGLRIGRAGDFLQHPRLLIFALSYTRFLQSRDRLDDAKAIWQEFVDAQTQRFGSPHRYVARALCEQGRFLDNNGEYAAASAQASECVAICRQLDSPDGWVLGVALAVLAHSRARDRNPQWETIESGASESIAILEHHLAERREARGHYAGVYRAKALLDLANALEAQGKFAEADAQFAKARQAADAIRGWTSANRRSLLDTALIWHGRFLRRTAQFERAVAAIQERKKLWPSSGQELYGIASEMAECASMLAKLDAPSVEQTALLAQTRGNALVTLREAVAAGFKDKAAIESNPKLKAIADDPQFQEILKELP